MLDGKEKRIFAGWMFAESPGLNALEHAVYDIWLAGCHRAPEVTSATKTEPGKKGNGRPATVPSAPIPPKKRPPR